LNLKTVSEKTKRFQFQKRPKKMTYNNKRWFREKEGPKNKVPTTELLDQNAEESSERGRNREKEMIHSLVCRH
jgi:hypothetical protein